MNGDFDRYRDLTPAELGEKRARVLQESLAKALGTPDPRKLASLSDREFQILVALASGEAICDIAAKYSLSASTISTYVARIAKKLETTIGRLPALAVLLGRRD